MSCPSGYAEIAGDIVGGGIKGGYHASLKKCESDCNEHIDCRSFKFSPSHNGGWCAMYKTSQPTGPKYQDFFLCARGNHLEFIL